jgi:UDP-N-acetylglucosamine acyltransferase
LTTSSHTFSAPSIHPTAIIHPTAEVATGVEVGPFCFIGPYCQIGPGCVLGPHVTLLKNVRLAAQVQVASGAVLGGDPQDLKFQGENTWVEVGEGSRIGECATINRSTGEGSVTRFGAHGLLMAYAHLGHNCQVGNQVIIANAVQLGGHVRVHDQVTLGGHAAIHQNVTIGRLAMVGGLSGVKKDVPPFTMADGVPAHVVCLNAVGLRRAGLSSEERLWLKRAYKELFMSRKPLQESLAWIESVLPQQPVLEELLRFIRASQRGILTGRALERQGLKESGAVRTDARSMSQASVLPSQGSSHHEASALEEEGPLEPLYS